MDTEELVVHYGRQGEVVEHVHTCIVDSLVILVQTLHFEGEIASQVATFVVA